MGAPWEKYQAQQTEDGPWKNYEPQQESTPSISDEFKRRSAISVARGENPTLAKAADLLSGMTSLPRGILNLVGIPFGKKPGDAVFPQEAVDKKSGLHLAGEILDPYALATGIKAAQGVSKAIPAASAAVQNILGGIAGGGLVGGLSDSEDRLKGAAMGGVGGAVAGVAVPVLLAGGNMVGNVIGPAISKKSAQKGAARLANEAAGTRQADVVSALRSGGANETAAQSATRSQSAEATALLDMMKGQRGSEYAMVDAAQEAARKAALKGVTPDLAAAEGRRLGLSIPFYQQSEKSVVTIDGQLADIFNRIPKDVLNNAAEIARREGRQFQIGSYQPAQTVPTGLLDASGKPILQNLPAQYPKITGESLHYVKRALSDMSNAADPTKGIGKDMQKAARSVLDDFLTEFEKRVPAYETGRTTFARESIPVNQSNVLNRMQGILDTGAGTERVTPFLNALGSGEQALLKRSTGFPRYESGDLAKLLSPQQKSVVDDIVAQMRLDQEVKRLSSAGNTGALKAMRATEKMPGAPNLMTWKVSLPNAILNRIEGKGGVKINEQLAELGLPTGKKQLADLMEQQVIRKILLEQYIQGGSGAFGGLLGNVTAD